MAAMVLIVALALATVRYGVLTPQGRLLIQARAGALTLGRVGRLKLEGLGGDIWRDFTIRRLTISDEKGAWLEADDLKVRWSYAQLVRRRLQIDSIVARQVRVLRRPTLRPKGPPSPGLPITFDIKALRFRLETLPAFSTTHGFYDVAASLKLLRGDRGQAGAIKARSLTHLGDFLDLSFDVGHTRPLLISARGAEAEGGAIAGALGLPADLPFSVRLDAAGSGMGENGRLDLDLRTGAKRPAWAHGAWTPQGGVIAGRLSLAASSLTRGYMRMFGPDAVVAAAARQAPGGVYGAALIVRARNLILDARGPADPAKLRSLQGLQLAVIAPDLSRFVAAPKMGAGRAQGVLSGDPSAWRFLGAVRMERPRYDGYSLGSVSGPVSISGQGGQLAVKAAMAGQGGAGPGLLAGLAGRAPKASLDAVKLKDGRILIRKADVQGAGVALAASGSRGLLGGLSFKGGLTVKELAVARTGAAGGLQLSWSAVQASARKPWLFTADGRGTKLRTGLAELDRLLGAEPKLRLRAAYVGGGLDVAEAALDGAKASASAQGKLDPKGVMAFKTRWRAEGPFQAGPVQISGKASGDGALTGTLAAPRADLQADFGSIDIPNLSLKNAHLHLAFLRGPAGFDGDFALASDSDYGPARAKAGFRFAPGGLDLSGIDADAGGAQMSGALALRNSSPSSADLKLAIGPGAVLTQGHVAGTVKVVGGASPTAAVDLIAQNAVLRGDGTVLTSAHLTGTGPLARLPFQLAADAQTPQGPLSIKGSGLYQQAGGVQEASISGAGRFRQVDFHTLEPISLKLAGQDRTARVRAELGGGRLELDAHVGGDGVAATAALRGVDLKTIDQDFTGKVDADVALHGKGQGLGGQMTARLQGARGVDAAANTALNATVKAVLQNDRLALDAQASGAKGMTSTVQVVLPVAASAAPLRLAILKTRPMQGRLQADGEVQPLWDLFYGGDRELGGQVRLSGVLGGTLNDPQLTGQASVAGGRLQDYSTGLVLTNLSMNAQLNRDTITIGGFNAKDEKAGAVTGSGTISLARGGGSDLKLDFQRFRLIDNDELQATASGQVTLTRGADGKVKVSGGLNITHAQINAAAKLRPGVVAMDVVERGLSDQARVQQLRPEPARGPPVGLDVTLKAPRGVFIKGRGVDAELSLDAHVTGTVAQPQLEGQARIYQGSYDFAGKRFDFDERGSIVLANDASQIRLDLSAAWEGPSLTATVKITGTAAKPDIKLTSTPVLPQEEILSQVLFGSSASQLSGAETAQLASTATAMATGGGFDVLGSLRQFAGLDRLALGGDQTSGVTVAGGKYIGDNVYLEVIGGGRYGPSAEVDWRVKRHLSLVSQIGSELGAKLAVRWTHDFGGQSQPQQRKPKPVK